MTVEEFLYACEGRGWHFTIQWVRRRLRELAKEASDAAQ
jgi:hypothetical protein